MGTYTARKLINDALYTAGVAYREMENVQPYQLQNGFTWLNDILADKFADIGLLPYYSKYEFTGVTGQEIYPIDNLINASTLTFNIGVVRYPVVQQSRDKYQGSARANNINSLPYSYDVERRLGGADLYMYFNPQDTYEFTLWGQFGLDEVATLDDDLWLVYDRFYTTYLRFNLAQRICEEMNLEVPANVSKRVDAYRKVISENVSSPDLNAQIISIFGGQDTVNYGQVNLGHGWTTPDGS